MLKKAVKRLVRNDSPFYRMVSRFYNYWRPDQTDLQVVLQNISNNHPDLIICQVGANDGKAGDPIAPLLRTNQWRGILVEPLPQMFELLKSNTKDIQGRFRLFNCAVDKMVGERIIYEIDYQEWMPPYFKELACFWKEKLPKTFYDRKVEPHILSTPIRTENINSILEQTDFNNIDAYFIDTEGHDYEVIKLIDMDRQKPDVIFFEHVALSTYDYKSCLKYLKSLQYRLYYQHRDTIAISDQINIEKV